VRFEAFPEVVHHHPLHLRRVPPHLRFLTRHALLTYAVKHWSNWQVRVLARIVQVESWLKGLIARRRHDPFTVEVFEQLGQLAAEVRTSRPGDARRRLEHVVRLSVARMEMSAPDEARVLANATHGVGRRAPRTEIHDSVSGGGSTMSSILPPSY
jgi:hypothetical protein